MCESERGRRRSTLLTKAHTRRSKVLAGYLSGLPAALRPSAPPPLRFITYLRRPRPAFPPHTSTVAFSLCLSLFLGLRALTRDRTGAPSTMRCGSRLSAWRFSLSIVDGEWISVAPSNSHSLACWACAKVLRYISSLRTLPFSLSSKLQTPNSSPLPPCLSSIPYFIVYQSRA